MVEILEGNRSGSSHGHLTVCVQAPSCVSPGLLLRFWLLITLRVLLGVQTHRSMEVILLLKVGEPVSVRHTPEVNGYSAILSA